MKQCGKYLLISCVICLLFCSSALPALALDESEVQQAVAEQGKEAVSGNIFVWFICAIAFLKVSQKIDSFMSSLGISVGHTGGNMLGEAMIAARSLGLGKRGGSRAASGDGASTADKGGFLSGGIVGAVGRQFSRSAVNQATSASEDGKAGGITGKMFETSMSHSGEFANSVIGTVATGSIAKTGSITGLTASRALSSYLGHNSPNTARDSPATVASPGSVPLRSDVTAAGGVNSVNFSGDTNDDSVHLSTGLMDAEPIGSMASSTVDSGGIPASASGECATETPSAPRFENVEIGGGRITGTEYSQDYPSGQQFAMYHTGQYTPPADGPYQTVSSADGAKWYKQYAQKTVERHNPHHDEKGQIVYDKRIVEKLPKTPPRKDKI